MSDLDPVIKEFLVESYENLDQLDRDLVDLETDPTNREKLANIFRTIHTIKGTCGFFDFQRLGTVTHVGENLLSRLRDGHLLLTQERASALLALVDVIRQILGCIESTGQEGPGDCSGLVERLTRLCGDAVQTPAPQHPAGACKVAATPEPAPEASEPTEHPDAVAREIIRVDVGVLDKVMTLVGELVLARNQILQLTATNQAAAFQGSTQRLNLITTELQEGVMKMRMQSINNVWQRFPRVVRDLALACGKQVRLTMEGRDTELDKTILEAIKDPLTHLIRNAVDHGIELPEVRRTRGKNPQGQLSLRAFHEGGQVNIEIADDGQGIHPARIREKVVERSLLTREQAERLSDLELIQLIFLPGFSTADQVTHVSGRGVGMDVVKSNIEKIGGLVDVQSCPGQGTTIKIKIPLTLAIIPALIVTSGGDCYAIPQVSLLELVHLEPEPARRGIERIHGTPVYRLRGRLLPLVYLDRQLQVQSSASNGAVNIVVLQADDRQFGLVVDAINDTEEIVVKPLGKLFKGIALFAGATIRGDGRVALILDVLGIAQTSGVISALRNRALVENSVVPPACAESLQTLLVLGLGDKRRLALPLAQVARLEEIPQTAVENAAHLEVVQYRGQILPLLRLAGLFPGGSEVRNDRQMLQVVVCTQEGRSVGLVVDRILDVVETPVEVQSTGRCPGLIGSAVIQQRVTDLLDIRALVRRAAPELLPTTVGSGA